MVARHGGRLFSWAWLKPAHDFRPRRLSASACSINLVEGLFSKLARSVLRHIRVSSKQELKERLMAASTSSIRI